MKINKKQFINTLLNITIHTDHKKREWNTIYQGNYCYFWNSQIWTNIMDISNKYGATISRNEFYSICKDHCNYSEFDALFKKISNNNTREFTSIDFENFMNKINDIDYHKIINCFYSEIILQDNSIEMFEPEPELNPNPNPSPNPNRNPKPGWWPT